MRQLPIAFRAAVVCALVVTPLVGCSGKSVAQGASSPAAAPPTPCVNGTETNSLYAGFITGLAVSGDQVVIGGSGIVRVPLAGGDPVTLASPGDSDGLLVLGGVAYFVASHAVGDPVQGKQPAEETLDAVPVSGGDTTTALGASDTPAPFFGIADATSLYFPSRNLSAIAKFTPPAALVDLDSGGTVLDIDAIAEQGASIYVAAQDVRVGGFTNGLIQRIPKSGGTAETIVSNIGHPWSLVADDTGLYWQEDPPGITGIGQIAHAQLDGSGISSLLSVGATSLAVSSGQLYFTTQDSVQSMPTSGGAVTTVASNQKSAGTLLIAGDNVVWVDPSSKSLSDPTVPVVLAACVPSAQ
jgi:hypothetical protein